MLIAVEAGWRDPGRSGASNPTFPHCSRACRLCGRSRLRARGSPHPKNFKELKGRKVATPSDQLPRGEWWAFYRDPKLDFLIKQVEISNQTVAAQAAAYEQARALIREAQAALFPTLNAAYSASRSFTGRT
jgi:outer membrane protein TolC